MKWFLNYHPLPYLDRYSPFISSLRLWWRSFFYPSFLLLSSVGNLVLINCYWWHMSLSHIGFRKWLSGKESACNAGDARDAGSIPESERSPGEGKGKPLQYSCLENSMDRGAWRATVHEFTKSGTWLSMHTCIFSGEFGINQLLLMAHAPVLYAYHKSRLVPDTLARISWGFQGMLTSFSGLFLWLPDTAGNCPALLQVLSCHTESQVL